MLAQAKLSCILRISGPLQIGSCGEKARAGYPISPLTGALISAGIRPWPLSSSRSWPIAGKIARASGRQFK